jgi:hypothetical protein
MSNPWATKLKKTGLIEKHLELEKASINELESKQFELRSALLVNNSKQEEYKNRQSSLAVDAIIGKQARLFGQK